MRFTDVAGCPRHTGTGSRDAMRARLDRHGALRLPLVAPFDGRIVDRIADAPAALDRFRARLEATPTTGGR